MVTASRLSQILFKRLCWKYERISESKNNPIYLIFFQGWVNDDDDKDKDKDNTAKKSTRKTTTTKTPMTNKKIYFGIGVIMCILSEVEWSPVCRIFHRLGPLGRVGHRVAMSVCMCVTKIIIIDNAQSITFFCLSS